MSSTTSVLITGAKGLLGTHCRALLTSINSSHTFRGLPAKYEIREASTQHFQDIDALSELVQGCDLVLHLAGINRATPEEVEHGNIEIAKVLVKAMDQVSAKPSIVYSNSTHSEGSSVYGAGKLAAGEYLAAWAVNNDCSFADIILPHLFGEGGVPNYNTVTATLCDCVAKNQKPDIHDNAKVELLHAGDAAELMLENGMAKNSERIRPKGLPISVQDLYDRILYIHSSYANDLFPELKNTFEVQLYNTYRYARFPEEYPRLLPINADDRGELFEVARGGSGGQVFLSWTNPGISRGDHFHRRKVERFVVLEGTAVINVRDIFSDKIHSFSVSGESPVAIDMPTLHTHNIINTGSERLLTLFWAHEVFDQNDPDTFMLKVSHSE